MIQSHDSAYRQKQAPLPKKEEALICLIVSVKNKFCPVWKVFFIIPIGNRYNQMVAFCSHLSELPARYKPVDDEPWHSRGIRRIIVNNFFVYYRIDEEGRRVYILNVIYARRDQLRVLEQMNID